MGMCAEWKDVMATMVCSTPPKNSRGITELMVRTNGWQQSLSLRSELRRMARRTPQRSFDLFTLIRTRVSRVGSSSGSRQNQSSGGHLMAGGTSFPSLSNTLLRMDGNFGQMQQALLETCEQRSFLHCCASVLLGG